MLTTRELAQAAGVTTVDIRNMVRRFPDVVFPIDRDRVRGKQLYFDPCMVAVVRKVYEGLGKWKDRRVLNAADYYQREE